MLESYIVYNAIVIVILCFAYLNAVTSSEFYRVKFRWIVFLTILVIGIIRYDVGPDYSRYASAYYSIQRYGGDVTLSSFLYYWLSRLFGNVPYGYVWVLGIYQFLTVFVLFRLLTKKDIFYFGIFLFVVLGFWFWTLDGVRQGLACVIFLYAVKYIEQKNLSKYLCCIAVAFVVHISSIFLLPVYWIVQKKYPKFLLCILLIVFIGGHYMQIWRSFFVSLYSMVPYYSDIYALTDHAEETGQFNSGLGFLWNVLLVFFVFWRCRNTVYLNLVVLGGILYFFAGGNLNITRIALYFLHVEYLAIPLIFKEMKGELFLKFLMIVLMMIYYQSIIQRNNFSYKTVFSKEFHLQKFEER